MPLFDFRCRSCGSEFEALVRSSDLPLCPSRKSAKLEQLPSMFTVSSLELTKARVRTARKERRRSWTYRDEIMAKRSTTTDAGPTEDECESIFHLLNPLGPNKSSFRKVTFSEASFRESRFSGVGHFRKEPKGRTTRRTGQVR